MDPITVRKETYGLGPRPGSKLLETLKTAGAAVALVFAFLSQQNKWATWIAGTVTALLFIDSIRGWIWDLRVRLRRRQARRQEAIERQVAAECVTRAIKLVKAHTDLAGSTYVNEVRALPSGLTEERLRLACSARDIILQTCSGARLLPDAATPENVALVAGFVAETVRNSFSGAHLLFAEAISNEQKREAAERIRSVSQDFRTRYNSVVSELAHAAPQLSHLLAPITEHELPPPPRVPPGPLR